MKGEIDKDFYCSCGVEAGGYGLCAHAYHNNCRDDCPNRHRKHPIPEQFLEEYGEEWMGAVYVFWEEEWRVIASKEVCYLYKKDSVIVCACTPFGKPDDDWRPE